MSLVQRTPRGHKTLVGRFQKFVGHEPLGLLEVIGETGTLARALTRELWRLAHEANVAICKRRPQRAVMSDMAQQLLVGIEAPSPSSQNRTLATRLSRSAFSTCLILARSITDDETQH